MCWTIRSNHGLGFDFFVRRTFLADCHLADGHHEETFYIKKTTLTFWAEGRFLPDGHLTDEHLAKTFY